MMPKMQISIKSKRLQQLSILVLDLKIHNSSFPSIKNAHPPPLLIKDNLSTFNSHLPQNSLCNFI